MKSIIIAVIAIAALTASAQDKPASTSAGMTKITFYRYSESYGVLRHPSIYCDEKEVVRIESGRFFALEVAPGTHTFRSSDKQNGLSLEMKAGQEYFVRFDFGRPGIFKGSKGRIFLVPAEQAKFEIVKLRAMDR